MRSSELSNSIGNVTRCSTTVGFGIYLCSWISSVRHTVTVGDHARRFVSLASDVVASAGSFFWENRRYVLRDLVVALLWAVVLTVLFVFSSLPGWLYYVLLFGGLFVYSTVTSIIGTAARLNQ